MNTKSECMNIGEMVYEHARGIFERCDASEDFCLQAAGGLVAVFGRINRVLYSPGKGFVPDMGYCTDEFLKKYGLCMYGAPIAKRKYALVPATRVTICEHPHVYYQGVVPCTGPQVCSMCGTAFVSDEEIEAARGAAQKEIEKRRK